MVNLPEGIKDSGSMIFGPQEGVVTVTLTPDMGPDDLHQKILDAITTLEDQEHVLFLVDLWGGTAFNQISRVLEEEGKEDWVAVTGLNLPMLIAAYGSRLGVDTATEVAKEIFSEARMGVKIKPEELQPQEATPTDVPTVATPQKEAIPVGTVIGDGKLKIVLARIDTRLLHGRLQLPGQR